MTTAAFFILYWVQYPDACVVIPAKAGIQNLDVPPGGHDKYLAACSEDYLLIVALQIAIFSHLSPFHILTQKAE